MTHLPCDACECPKQCQAVGRCMWDDRGISGNYDGRVLAHFLISLIVFAALIGVAVYVF